ncbi:prepilin-type N-terminal cleavage/methylation domain-containing protein [Levilactobacillus spicheri]|uniref:Prepilin-type N-terminal cleavage/methylation domain-containing protein n=1 Tax=Levilactobacillus spicheri TaxID=216463 RepID=A0A0F3RPN4_9LACO|nr:prepilin-type N-terminal cleavage/methylation domain-containing protein [Levilactobacillus spicheri]KJW11983.1 hypothetical protein VC81_12265 [Levilactobacillus spicheri]
MAGPDVELMAPRTGFTLVEALLALSIGALLVGLTAGWERQTSWHRDPDPAALYLFLQRLEQRGRYRYLGQHGKTLVLADHAQADKHVQLTLDAAHTLRWTDDRDRGNFLLLRGVRAIEWRELRSTDVVRLRIQWEGATAWDETLVDLRGTPAVS